VYILIYICIFSKEKKILDKKHNECVPFLYTNRYVTENVLDKKIKKIYSDNLLMLLIYTLYTKKLSIHSFLSYGPDV